MTVDSGQLTVHSYMPHSRMDMYNLPDMHFHMHMRLFNSSAVVCDLPRGFHAQPLNFVIENAGEV